MEAALVLPVFFIAIIGIVEFGRGMMVSQVVTNTAREAARQAILDGSDNVTITKFAEDTLAGATGATASDVTVNIALFPRAGSAAVGNSLATAEADDLVEIEVSIPYDAISYSTGRYLGGRSLSAKATMRHE